MQRLIKIQQVQESQWDKKNKPEFTFFRAIANSARTGIRATQQASRVLKPVVNQANQQVVKPAIAAAKDANTKLAQANQAYATAAAAVKAAPADQQPQSVAAVSQASVQVIEAETTQANAMQTVAAAMSGTPAPAPIPSPDTSAAPTAGSATQINAAQLSDGATKAQAAIVDVEQENAQLDALEQAFEAGNQDQALAAWTGVVATDEKISADAIPEDGFADDSTIFAAG